MIENTAWAILSVFDKTGLIGLAEALLKRHVGLISTGGTAKKLDEWGLPYTPIGNFTGFPEMLDGRVKTLHPKVHGAILHIRGNTTHEAAVVEHGIAKIDFVIVNLYPFAATIAKPRVTLAEVIENIDIGGPAMLRSAGKNHEFVTAVCDPADYPDVTLTLERNGSTTLAQRRLLAAKVFNHTGAYDTMIGTWMNGMFN